MCFPITRRNAFVGLLIFLCASCVINRFRMEMNTREIDASLKNCPITRNFFVGTFSCSQIPPLPLSKRRRGWILNVDPSGPGTHWVAAFVNERNKIWYFDSTAEEPNKYIQAFLNQFSAVEKLNFRLQNFFSDICGQYCVYFIYSCCKKKSFERIVGRFSRTNLAKNDAFIKKWIVRFLRRNLNAPLSDLSSIKAECKSAQSVSQHEPPVGRVGDFH